MRKLLLVAALVAAPVAGLATAPASAYCDPKYYPLCLNDCQLQPPDPRDPLEYLTRVCAAE